MTARPCIPPPPPSRDSGVYAIPPERAAEMLADWREAERVTEPPTAAPTEEIPPCWG